MLNSILPFIVLILVVVFIHEYGHYYFAKKYGVKVTDFSIGFGKELFGWNDKLGTRWKICWIPLGGYVKFFGDRNVFRENCTIHRGTTEEVPTRIGNDNLFLAYSHVAHDCQIADHCIFSNNATLGGHCEVFDYAIISGLSAVHQFSRIGEHCMIGGCSRIPQDVPPFCMAEGNRANLRGLNLTGLRRHIGRDDINALKSAYRELFESGQPLKETASRLLEETKNHYVNDLCDFVLKTKRGIPFERKNNDK